MKYSLSDPRRNKQIKQTQLVDPRPLRTVPYPIVHTYSATLHGQRVKIRVCAPAAAAGCLQWPAELGAKRRKPNA